MLFLSGTGVVLILPDYWPVLRPAASFVRQAMAEKRALAAEKALQWPCRPMTIPANIVDSTILRDARGQGRFLPDRPGRMRWPLNRRSRPRRRPACPPYRTR